MANFRELFLSLFAVDSVWSVVLRAAVWCAISVVIIVSTDATNPQQASRRLKSNLGFFLLFLFLSGGLIYMLFSFTATPATTAATPTSATSTL